jgi:uncharacterized membrane-anchored protein
VHRFGQKNSIKRKLKLQERKKNSKTGRNENNKSVYLESAILIVGLTPIDMKIKECVDLFNIKSTNTGIISGIDCEYVEKKIDIKSLPHPAFRNCTQVLNRFKENDYK